MPIETACRRQVAAQVFDVKRDELSIINRIVRQANVPAPGWPSTQEQRYALQVVKAAVEKRIIMK